LGETDLQRAWRHDPELAGVLLVIVILRRLGMRKYGASVIARASGLKEICFG